MAIARLTMSARYGGQILQNVFHLKKSDATSAELVTLLADWKAHWLDVYKDNMASEVQWLTLHGEILQTGGGGAVADLVLTETGGGGSDTRVPLQLAMVVQLRTGLAGRKNRGRIYMYGITCNWLSSGVWNPTNLASAQTRFDTLAARWLAGTEDYLWRLVIHGKDDGPDESRDVTQMQVRALPGTQRRRQVGVGI